MNDTCLSAAQKIPPAKGTRKLVKFHVGGTQLTKMKDPQKTEEWAAQSKTRTRSENIDMFSNMHG
ncbi:hypothetical protein BGZ76_005233 [Entomortierella beljakovae]|nr:hypothetical protein BGZ76_005233 [Entomortierella beljakovae]